IESLIHERRHSDENNASMLETMQQAIIRVLDRIDALELAQQHGATGYGLGAPQPMQPQQPYGGQFVAEEQPGEAPAEERYEAPRAGLFAQEQVDEAAPAQQAPFPEMPFDFDAAFAREAAADAGAAYGVSAASPQQDTLRHDFVADAHRAKLKAATKLEASE